MTKILLTVPKKDDSITELNYFLQTQSADIYIFPEGFLSSGTIDQALDIIRKNDKFVIAGYKDLHHETIQEKALVIDRGRIIDEYTKCILTQAEKNKGKKPGTEIRCVETKFGKIGIPICYEIHFPEVARIMCMDGPVLLVNLIGTGMYHELQYEQWTSIAKARAKENEIHIVGCSHYAGEIPLAYAFSCSGKKILEARGNYGCFPVELDFGESSQRVIHYFEDRLPDYFKKICE